MHLELMILLFISDHVGEGFKPSDRVQNLDGVNVTYALPIHNV